MPSLCCNKNANTIKMQITVVTGMRYCYSLQMLFNKCNDKKNVLSSFIENVHIQKNRKILYTQENNKYIENQQLEQ